MAKIKMTSSSNNRALVDEHLVEKYIEELGYTEGWPEDETAEQLDDEEKVADNQSEVTPPEVVDEAKEVKETAEQLDDEEKVADNQSEVIPPEVADEAKEPAK